MGEVAVSGERGMELQVQEIVETEKSELVEANNQKIAADGGGSAAAVGWERFLPKTVVRVLLVEADDSTRQIISALLRKCSYRVAAVGDGLKAWEVLKGRPNSIDLILTEVDLPSISGYALLTLIMEHEVCKNIPVIMMSWQDSVSTVYKCMLKGAADFLVKPVRKNELRNLWQHVWRKQASSTSAGIGPPDESLAEEKDEATAENNANSNHSSGFISCIQKNRDGIEKGSDAQSSCSKPESETQGEDMEHVHSLSQTKSAKRLSDDSYIPTQEECHQQDKKRRALDREAGELQTVANNNGDRAITPEYKNSNTVTPEDKNSDVRESVKAIGQNIKDNHLLEDSSRVAIDLIGAFDNYLKGTFGTSAANVSVNKFDILPLLDLSLRRSNPSVSINLVNDERPGLNHSDASPFSRYVNKPFQVSNSTTPSTCNQQNDYETNPEKQPSNQTSDYNTHTPIMNSPKDVPMDTIQTGRPEFPFSSFSQNRNISHPIPVRGLRYENVMNAMPSAHSVQSGSSPFPSPGTTHHSDPIQQSPPFCPPDHQLSSSQQWHGFGDQRTSNSIDQTENKQVNKVEDLEDHGLVSPGNDQSGNSSFCTGNISHHQSAGSGSTGKINAISVIKCPAECGSGNEECFQPHEGASHRSMLREAALTKFRLKRKDRCFDKKVRYESRKKLAEQRPRVKGQFVRQMPTDPLPENSLAG